MPHTLSPLPYSYDALEPHYDEATLKIHHDKHHRTYVDNLNGALEGLPDQEAKTLEDLLRNLDQVPESIQKKVANNAGGVWNHDFFWRCMGPGKGGTPSGKIAAAIDEAFGSFKNFQASFKESALAVFGSGWAYLLTGKNGLEIRNFANQETPISENRTPLLTIDVWEHPEWIDSWWNVVDWDGVNERLR
jgi:Fe-Mn family superoxide dismutase